MLGRRVGSTVVGALVGAADGEETGLTLGFDVGSTDGIAVGKREGRFVGARVGVAEVGRNVGTVLGNGVCGLLLG